MDTESSWRRADEIFDQLLDLAPSERAAALAALELDASMRARVERLLAASETDDGILDQAPLSVPSRSGLRGTSLGPWLLQEEIGRGGMSVVYRARHRDFEGREAAVKVLALGSIATEGLARFTREQAVLARLSHPGIVPLYDAGQAEDGTPWIAMALVSGARIDHWCAEHQPDCRARVALVLQVIDAVDYAHRSLIVHRDLKPGNVMVEADGRVRLLDFGIAGLLSESDERSRTLMSALTPEYAAPEQFESACATTAMDVYGLGALLQRVLTGAPPQRDPSARIRDGLPSSAIRDGCYGDQRAQTRARSEMQGDLDAILLKALDPDPRRRYGGALQLGDDLQRWLQGRPVTARRPTLAYRTLRYVQRHRLPLALGAAAVISIVLALASALHQARQASDAAARAQAQSRRAELQGARAEALNAFLLRLFSSAAAGQPQSELPDLGELLDLAARQLESSDLVEADLRAHLLSAIGRVYGTLGAHERGVELLSRALPLAADVEQRAGVLAGLARVQFRAGRYVESLESIESVLSTLDAKLASPALLEELNDVRVAALLYLGRTDEALQVAEAHYRHVSTMADVDTNGALRAGAAYSLATARTQNGEGALARALLVEALGLIKDGAVDWELKISLRNALAASYREVGEPAKAIEHRGVALELARRLYPPGHVRIGQTMNNLASDLTASHRLEEALAMSSEALEVLERTLGGRHPSLASAYNNRGVLLSDLGRHDEALADQLRADSIMAELPPSDFRRLLILLNRAEIEIRRERPVEALVLLDHFEKFVDDALPPRHRARHASLAARAELQLGEPVRAQQRSEEAQALARLADPEGGALAALATLRGLEAGFQRGVRVDLVRIDEADAMIAKAGAELGRAGLSYLQERDALLRAMGDHSEADKRIAADIARLEALLGASDSRFVYLRQQLIPSGREAPLEGAGSE
jgi:tetratricopeptide (TPR) repeat protein